MSKPWGNIGAWAAEAEREEAEEREAKEAAAANQNENQSFPSLKEAVVSANSKTTKKKKMTLNEFITGAGDKGLTPDEKLRLPTGPKERSPEEMQYGRLGGGFQSYGRSGSMQGRGRDRDDGDGSWGGGGRRSYGGFDEERRGPSSRASDFDQPSRADEVDNWKAEKKSLPSFDSGRQNRYGSLGGGSRADEVDDWAFGKKAQAPPPVRSSTFGSGGFREPEPDRWNKGGGFRESGERERPRLVLDPPKGDAGLNEPPPVVAKTNKPSPFGAARPREEILAEKGLDWKKMDSEIEAKKTSRPTSAHSSRPSSAQSSRSEGPGLQGIENVVKPRPKVNPFGDAKPREVLLEERGKDWRKIDLELEHRGVDRPETEDEKRLKEEIDNLKKELEKESPLTTEPKEEAAEDQPSLQDRILQKERELEKLIRDLNDKVRFGQKAAERPGSGAGRGGGFLDRPPSQSGPFEESRSMEFTERPRSHGTGDIWTRPADDRRAFQGGRERGFLGNRDLDRPRSRERW